MQSGGAGLKATECHPSPHLAADNLQILIAQDGWSSGVEHGGEQAEVLDPHERRGEAGGGQLFDDGAHLLQTETESAISRRGKHAVQTK